MKTIFPFPELSAAEKTLVQEGCADAAAQWLKEWFGASVTLDLNALVMTETDSQNLRTLHVEVDDLLSLQSALLGSSRTNLGRSDFLPALGQTCLNDLKKRLSDFLLITSESATQETPAEADWSYAGGYALQMNTSAFSIKCQMPLVLLFTWIFKNRHAQAETRQLDGFDLKTVLKRFPITLQVKLNESTLLLTDLLHLKTGDMLGLDEKLDQALPLYVDNQRIGLVRYKASSTPRSPHIFEVKEIL